MSTDMNTIEQLKDLENRAKALDNPEKIDKNVDKYVGIVHEFGKSSFLECDCIGLCKLFYRTHGWRQTFSDKKPITKDWQNKEGVMRLFRYFKKNFKQTPYADDLDFGDVVLFKINGDFHFGIYVDAGKVLAMEVPVVYGKSQCTLYHRRLWIKGFCYGYKRDPNAILRSSLIKRAMR